MKRLTIIFATLAAALVLPLAALANPMSPMVQISGSVKINGADAPMGTVVTASAGSAQVGSVTLTAAGQYAMNLAPSAAASGTLLTFKVGDKTVADTGSLFKMPSVATQPVVSYDLAITTSSSSGGPSGGGGRTTPTPQVVPPVTEPEEEIGDLTGDEEGQVLGATAVNVVDGDIIQCRNSSNPNAVYIVKIVGEKKYIRHIVSLEIFNYYAHLKWEQLIQVESLDGFSLSGWVRVNTGANGQPGPSDKVWEINGDQTRHWIDMTASEFLQHGGSEEAIYSINQGELNLYREGAAVKLM